MSPKKSYETLIVEAPQPGVTLIKLNRPEALNALNSQLLGELGAALDAAEADEAVRCLVLTGSERAFAAGADIKEMSDKSYAQMFVTDFFGPAARRIEACRKPVIAAAASWPCCATLSSRPRPRSSASPRSTWASCRASAAPSACRARSARPRPW